MHGTREIYVWTRLAPDDDLRVAHCSRDLLRDLFVHFEGIERHRIAYVGDSVTMDIGGARAAGLHPILLDPYDDHVGADFDRVRSLLELL